MALFRALMRDKTVDHYNFVALSERQSQDPAAGAEIETLVRNRERASAHYQGPLQLSVYVQGMGGARPTLKRPH